MSLDFPVPSDEKIRVTIIQPDDPNTTTESEEKTIASDPIANPARLRITDVEVVSYEAATEESPAVIVVRIQGTGFSDDLKASVGEIAVKSATEAILTIPNPEAAAVVIITDEQTGQRVKTIVTRKTKPSQ
jgi:hypothetical protein